MELRNPNLLAGVLAGLCMLNPAAAQNQEPGPNKPPAEAARTKEQWIADLGAENFRVRLEAEKALRAMGKEALPALREAAEHAVDGEVQWRARRLIRQIERGADPGLQQRPGAGVPPADPDWPRWRAPRGLPDDVRERFDEMFRRMERDFGLDIPHARFFEDGFFRDLEQQMQQMQRMQSGSGRSHGMSMQIGPDGAVRVEVQEKNDKGEVEKKVYEAPDLETFQKQYPGVLQQNGLGGGLQFWFGRNPPPLALPLDPDPFAGRLLRPQPLRPRAPADAPAPPPDGRRLGIYVRPEIPADVREYLELEAGVGLMVESVLEGTLAQKLGLAPGDIVVAIAGRPIGSTEDVQAALGEVPGDQKVEVKFLRRGVEKMAAAVRAAPREPGEPGEPGEKVEKREPQPGGAIR